MPTMIIFLFGGAAPKSGGHREFRAPLFSFQGLYLETGAVTDPAGATERVICSRC